MNSSSLFGPNGEPPTADELFQRFNVGDTDDLIGLDRYEFTRMLKELTGGGRYGTSEDFQEWADSQFRLADGDFDGVVCRDEFVMFYWKKIIFLFPPVKGAKAANRLYDIFVDFCSEGSTVRQEAMGFTRWRRVCTLCRLISPGRLSAGDVDIAFKSIVGRKRSKECCTRPSCCCGAMKAKNELDYDQFLEALSLVAEKRKEGVNETIARIVNSKNLPKSLVRSMDFIRFAEDDYTYTAQLPARLDQSKGREDSGVDKNSALSSSVLDLPYRGQGTLRGADFFDPDELVPRLYEIFRMYSASGDAGSLLALEWMELQMLMRDGGLVGSALAISDLEKVFNKFKNRHDHNMHFHQFIECLKAVASRLRRSLNEIVEQLIISLYPRVIHALKRGKDPATVPAPSPEASPPAQGATQPPAGDPDTSYGTSFAEDSALDGERGSDHGDPTAPSKQVAEGGEERRTESSDAGSHQVSDAAANGAAEGAEMMSGRGGGEGSVIDGADAWGAAGENISLADGGGAESDDVRAGVDGDSGIDEVVDDAGEVVDEVDEEDDLLVDEEFLTEAHARNAFIPPDTPMRGVAA